MAKHASKLLGVVAAIAIIVFGYYEVQDGGGPGSSGTSPSVAAPQGSRNTENYDFAGVYTEAANQIRSAFESERSDLWIEAGGQVQRTLEDDSEGSRHQRFIVRLPNDHTVLIAHNIDLAQRIPIRAGDPISFYGEYEWNDRGGVVHWTHHDPNNRREGGWIRHKGTTYR